MNLRDRIADYPNFPKKGIIFRDFGPMLRDPSALSTIADEFSRHYNPRDVDLFAGIDSRGFILACLLATRYNKGMVMIRKAGKLPGKTAKSTYTTEYSKDTMEIQKDAISNGQRVVICDDMLATWRYCHDICKTRREDWWDGRRICIHHRADGSQRNQKDQRVQLQVIGEILVEESAEIGIFGGTGIYDSGLLDDVREITIKTPYGMPSDAITVGTFKGRRIAFLPRHGRGHTIPPHMINFRANIWAFRELGISRIVSPSAVGSLREELAPGRFVMPSQFLDFTKSRKGSFSEEGRVIHIISGRSILSGDAIVSTCRQRREKDMQIHTDATYVCIEGPRFSTKAESRFYRSTGADIIGMTLVPECQLAREAQMCYVSIATVTDYDVWAEKPVTTKEVMATISENVKRGQGIF